MTRPARARPPRARDPYGVGPVGSWIAPAASVVGLLIVAILTLNLMNGELPLGSGSGSNGNGDGNGDGPARTAAPSGVVVIPDEAAFEGSIVYAKGGEIFIQVDDEVTQLTDSGGDSMPSWSPDGEWVYYIKTTTQRGYWPVRGRPANYDIDVPELMRVRSDGSAEPESLVSGKFTQGDYTWSFWMRQPVLGPDGRTVAMVTDAPSPEESNVVLQFYDVETGGFTPIDVPDNGVLGHQDPIWRHDAKFLLYVLNGRDGSTGAPVIVRYETATGGRKVLTSGGYLQPSYSPDGRYIAATRTTSRGNDIVIIDGATGGELLRVTSDDSSFAPTWSPAGDGIAFLHLDGQTVDLRLARLGGSAPRWTVEEIVPLTEVSGLDPVSRPDWFIPADQLPATPPPSVAPSSTAEPTAAP
jgi:dipeptidyl aminopeptidase/acylaminoacyl peptidase